MSDENQTTDITTITPTADADGKILPFSRIGKNFREVLKDMLPEPTPPPPEFNIGFRVISLRPDENGIIEVNLQDGMHCIDGDYRQIDSVIDTGEAPKIEPVLLVSVDPTADVWRHVFVLVPPETTLASAYPLRAVAKLPAFGPLNMPPILICEQKLPAEKRVPALITIAMMHHYRTRTPATADKPAIDWKALTDDARKDLLEHAEKVLAPAYVERAKARWG